jgi:hypothetical protein
MCDMATTRRGEWHGCRINMPRSEWPVIRPQLQNMLAAFLPTADANGYVGAPL